MERSFAFLGPYDTILKKSRSFREPNLIKDASLPEIKDISSPLTIISGISYNTPTIKYQENSMWRRSKLDLQRRVFRTITYTIWAPQIFYLMKRKRKEDLQVNLWDFSRQSDDMMSEFWFAFIKFSRQDYWICIQR